MLQTTAPRVESLFEVANPLPEGFDSDNGRGLFARNFSEVLWKVIRTSIRHYPDSFFVQLIRRADRVTNQHSASFLRNAAVHVSKDRNIFSRGGGPFRWLCHGHGGVDQSASEKARPLVLHTPTCDH